MQNSHEGEQGWNSWLYNFSIGRVPAHDLLCQHLESGRRAAIEALPAKENLQVLEVGVGSGLSLRYYPESISVTGIDPSGTMLEQAERRRVREAVADVTLKRMRGEKLTFEDASFDATVMVHVLSVVENVERLLREIHRVTRAGGSLIVVNAFHQENFLLRLANSLLGRKGMLRVFGFHANLREEEITQAVGWRTMREDDVKRSRLFVLEKQ